MADACIISTYAVHVRGYPRRRYRGRVEPCHRVAWMEAYGDIPDGLCVLHRCDNRRCINVTHLFLGTRADNAADMVAKRRSVQPNAKLDRYARAAIRVRLAAGESGRAIARELGLAQHTVNRLRPNHGTWKD